jgi:cytochrome b6-f complex iron-sulfur subunit
MADEESKRPKRQLSRREWLSLAGVGGSVAVVGLLNAAFFRSLYLDLLYEPSKVFRVGKPEHFPLDSVVKLPERPVFICRDRGGIYAISAVCTHLGCIVGTSEEGFACPCHGSKYDPGGKVLAGPAPRNLPWWRMTLAPDGQVVVNAAEPVKPGQKLKV